MRRDMLLLVLGPSWGGTWAELVCSSCTCRMLRDGCASPLTEISKGLVVVAKQLQNTSKWIFFLTRGLLLQWRRQGVRSTLGWLPRSPSPSYHVMAKVMEKDPGFDCAPIANSQLFDIVTAVSFFAMYVNITWDRRRCCILNIPLTSSKIFQENFSVLRKTVVQQRDITWEVWWSKSALQPQRTGMLSAYSSLKVSFAPPHQFAHYKNNRVCELF